MSYYYISYKQAVPWNGAVFNVNEYRKAINLFYSKIDLVNPNLKTEQSVSLTFSVPVKDLSPDARFPNEWTFDLNGYFSTSVSEEVPGSYYRAFLVLGGDVKVPRGSNPNLREIIASSNKSIVKFGKSPAEAFNSAFKEARESLLQTLADQIAISGKDIKVERQDAFTDPEPALVGPPTQNISGVAYKAPVVDNPNIKLPTQEVKQLDPNIAQQAASKAQGSVGNLTSQAQGAVGDVTNQAQGAVSQAQGAVGGAVSQAQGAVGGAGSAISNLSSGIKGALGGGALGAGIGALAGGGKGALIGAGAGLVAGGVAGTVVDKLNPKGLVPDGLGKNWSPDKFSPQSIAGNTKYVDPKTGVIGSTSNLAKTLGGAALGGGIGAGIGSLAGGGKGALIGGLSGGALGAGAALGGIGGTALAGAGLGGGIGAALGGGKGALIGAASGGAIGAAAAKLSKVQAGMPKPKIPKPLNTPRIKTVKIPRPDTTKGVESLLNLPKS